jgi:hypothetical protein
MGQFVAITKHKIAPYPLLKEYEMARSEDVVEMARFGLLSPGAQVRSQQRLRTFRFRSFGDPTITPLYDFRCVPNRSK